jgi:hypothetical protein
MLDDALRFLSADWPIIVLIGLLLLSLLVSWRAGRAHPGTRRPRLNRPKPVVGEPMPKGEPPAWRGVRH